MLVKGTGVKNLNFCVDARLGSRLGEIKIKRLFFYSAFAAAVLVAAMLVRSYMDKPSATASAPPIGGAFNLTDHNGKAVTDADFRGRYMLVFFGYTYCPDICPTAMQTISDAMDMLGDKAADIVPLFISIDPKRDTPESLKLFVGSFHPNIIGLTGTPDQVAAAAKSYVVYYAEVAAEGGGPDDYLMNHSSITYLMGPDGRFITHFSHGIPPKDMADRLGRMVR